MNSLRRFVSATFLLVALSIAVAWAQDEQTAPAPAPPAEDQQVQQQAPPPPPGHEAEARDQQDPPSRAARLQYMSGSVSIQPHGTDEWVGGTLNRPLTTNDNVWTDKDSRAELNVGTGIVRMSSETSLTLTNVGDNAAQVELHQGTVNLRVRHLFDGEIYEVDTPNMAFTVQKTGEYRFEVDPNGDASIVTVWKGEGDATGNGPSVRVKAHERARFSNGTSLAHEISAAPGLDGFDDWCRVRDERQDHSVSARYVAPGVVGSEDLDAYGTWRELPQYGSVWVPSGVAAGWSPYSVGHWVWISPWGWTWVDNEPWGFAPYHYGRWIDGGGFWGWAPGPYYARPFYAPALVAWFGGPGWGVNVGFGFGGGIGWCPLGWGEPFLPWYRTSRGYFEHVNIYNTHINNINRFSNTYWNGGRGPGAGNSFHYANLRGGIAVPQRTLTNSLAVRGTAVHMSANDFARGSLGGRVPVTPGRNSMLGANAGRPAAAAPARSFARPVVSRMAPPAGGRMQGNAGFNAAARGPEGRTADSRFNSGATNTGRFVPRPPQNGASQNGSFAGRGMEQSNNHEAMSGRGAAVPRPQEGRTMGSSSGQSMNRSMGSGSTANRAGAPSSAMNRSMPSAAPMNRAVPRPPENARSMPQGRTYSAPSGSAGSAPRTPNGGNSSPNRQSQPSAPRSNERSSPGRMGSVPRPTGPVRAAANYQAEGSRYSSQGYSSGSRQSYGGSIYGGTRSYGAPSYGSSAGYGGRSYSQPSNRSYSAPSSGGYSGGSRGYSAPSSHSSAPSSRGSYGGGGRSSSGGGYSGGGHSGGGGGGGHGHGR